LKTIVLDRDGVINENRSDHVKKWSEFQFLPGVPEAIARLNEAGIPVFVVTNQAIINRRMVPKATVQAINAKMVQELRRRGARIEAVACCPHRPDERCGCRKPRPGLLFDLADQFGLDLSDVVVIGDALSDVEAGKAAGCDAILVLTGRGREQLAQAMVDGRRDFKVASDLAAAVSLALQRHYPAAHSPAA
jgi:D-glycero-D-manno-heptose 1,7-bisphosphate phosphatase